jgi:DNA-binding beta-propeller fold protein YncE
MKWRKISKKTGLGLAAACLALAGCGSKSTNTLIVAVIPGSATIIVKQQQSFTASVTGTSNTNVTWTLTISSKDCTPGCGTLDSTTNATITYTAPATIPSALVPAAGSTTPAAPLTLTATSAANSKKSGTATITLDSGIRVSAVTPATATIAAGSGSIQAENLPFTASLVNDTGGVTWLLTQATTVNGGSASCSPGCGSISISAPPAPPTTCTSTTCTYIAPNSLPTSTSVTVVAVSMTDPTRFATATITLVDPTKNVISFTGISPTTAPLGALQQDIYLNVTNLRSTVSIFFTDINNNSQLISPASGQVKIVNASVARLRLNATQLAQAQAGNVQIGVEVQNTNTIVNQLLGLKAVRPAIVAAVSDSFPLNTSPAPVSETLDGGFFGSLANPLVKVSYGGGTVSVPAPGPRQLGFSLTLRGEAGLFPLSVTSTLLANATPPATTNVAVQPDLVNNPASIVKINNMNQLPLPGANSVTSPVPSAIAVDSTLGIAVVTEQASNSVQLVNLTNLAAGTLPVLPPGGQITSGFNQPTGVAIDDQLPTHEAAVVNSGDSTLTILQITPTLSPPASVLGKPVNLGALIPSTGGSTAPSPFAVGIDPFTHLALVAFSNANVGFIVNVDPNNGSPGCIPGTAPASLPKFCPVGSVSLNTGAKPQIAFEPRLHLAFVSPGGRGLMSVVDLTQKGSTTPIAAAPTGASRAQFHSGSQTEGLVTITTTTAHNINPAVLGTVLITGVSPADFNGSFQVSNVIDSTHFQYIQPTVSAVETGGGGNVSFGSPDLTFSISNTNQGIAINPETRAAVVADPNATIGQISFISTLDEGVTSLTLNAGGGAPEIGATWVAVQPFTNVAVSFNPSRNEVSFIDPAKPQRLALPTGTGQTGIGSYNAGGTTVTVTGGLAVDPATNLALVVNSGSNSLVAISIGNTASMKAVHISQVQLFTAGVTPSPYEIPGAILPQAVLSSNSAPVPIPTLGTIKILGAGFKSGSPVQVRLDGDPTAISTTSVMSDTEIDITINPAFLTQPRHFALDVVVNGVGSNAEDFTVVQTIDVSKGCSGTSTPQPGAVAIDEQRNIAVVANSGCNDISIIDLTPGASPQVKSSVAVGASPAGVAVIPRLGFAVVTNNGAGTASIVNLDTATTTATVTVGTSPLGVAINQDTGAAVIANNGSSNVSLIDLTASTPKAVNATVDTQPIAVAIDPDRGTNGHGLAVVTALQQSGVSATGVLDVVDIGTGTPVRNANATASFLTAAPTGIVFDAAVSPGLFYVTESDGNLIGAFNPDIGQVTPIRVGINPTSIAYNLQTGTILTVNTVSNTISVIDSQTFKTRGTFGIGGSPQFAAAIHPRTNMAVIADQVNNRVILYPLPK